MYIYRLRYKRIFLNINIATCFPRDHQIWRGTPQ